MGKVSLAFDHLEENTQIKELSLVIYRDSFFYGLWDESGILAKTGYHPHQSLPNLIEIWNYHYDLTQTKAMSTYKPYVHIPSGAYLDHAFDLYFTGLYDLGHISDHDQMVDETRTEAITTLHYIDRPIIDSLLTLESADGVVHISTAMIDHLNKKNRSLVFYSSENKLHVCYVNDQGFQLYNQYDCYYEADYLYFIQLILQRFEIDKSVVPVLLSGDMSSDKSRIELVNQYVDQIYFVEQDLELSQPLPHHPSNYFDLQLCRTCG